MEEEAVFKFYTNKSYYKFNQALISNSKIDDILEIEKLLNQALDKIPSSPGTYYRGIGKEEIAMLDKLKKVDKVIYENFMSTSKDRSYAGTFARKNFEKTNETALIEIQSKNGISIIKYSDLEKEMEVLHKSKTEFILEDIKDIQILNVFEHQFEYQPAVKGKVFVLIEK